MNFRNNHKRQNRNNHHYQQRNIQRTDSSLFLNSTWKLYIHNLTEKDWSLDSYKYVCSFKTIEDFWNFFNNYTDFRNFNFYIMRENIKPVYEDEENKNGYSYSYIIPGRKVTETFVDILVKMVSENLLDEKNAYEICGVSLTPKPKGISILKVWLKNKDNVLNLRTNNENLINGRFQPHKFY